MLRVLTGPTGVGKTQLALELSKVLINTDPFQFYKEIPIISNQPHKKKSNPLQEFHFLGDRSIAEPLSSGTFARLAQELFETPGIWVGTGL